MKILEIPDDSGFTGIANFEKHQSFISEDWDFEMIQNRIVAEINSHHLLFWATGFENTWKVKVDDKSSSMGSFRDGKGVIEVTSGKISNKL